jgi:RNA polymerase sigma-70 factor (ECF subfamily)
MANKKDRDHKLMARVADNDLTAFNELVNLYKGKLFTMLVRMVGTAEEAEDLLQETYVRVWEHRRNFDDRYCFSTWVYTIAMNLGRNELRKRRKVKFFGLFDRENNPIDVEDPSAEHSGGIGVLIDRAVKKLPARYREAFELRDLQELSYDEIGDVLGVPVGTVKSRVNRARNLLKDELKPKVERYYGLSKSPLLPSSIL